MVSQLENLLQTIGLSISISLNMAALLSNRTGFPFRPGWSFACNYSKTTKAIKLKIQTFDLGIFWYGKVLKTAHD